MEPAEKLALIHDLQDRLKALIGTAAPANNIGDQVRGSPFRAAVTGMLTAVYRSPRVTVPRGGGY